MSKTTNKFPRQCASAQCNWCLITNMNILCADRRSAIMSISSKIGTSPTLNEWVKKADVDACKRAGYGGQADGLGTGEPGSFSRPTRSCAQTAG